MLEQRCRQAFLQSRTRLLRVLLLQQLDDPVAVGAHEAKNEIRSHENVALLDRAVEFAHDPLQASRRDADREPIDPLQPIPELHLDPLPYETHDKIPARFDEKSRKFVNRLGVTFFGNITLGDLRELLSDALDLRVIATLERHAHGRREHVAVDFEHLVSQFGVRKVVEVQQVAEHVQTGFAERCHLSAAGLDFDEAQLRERAKTFSNRAPVHARALDEVALGRNPIARAQTAAKDVISQIADHALDSCREGKQGGALGAEVV